MYRLEARSSRESRAIIAAGVERFFEPLSPRDAWFIYAERADAPLDVATAYVVEGESSVSGGRGAAGIEETNAERLHLFPRYRQKLHRVALNLSHPVWIDDPDFDLGFHIRHEKLPEPANGAKARAAVARILSRPLPRNRPLWEMVVLHGLPDGRLMIVNRAHHAMVDGLARRAIMPPTFDHAPQGAPRE